MLKVGYGRIWSHTVGCAESGTGLGFLIFDLGPSGDRGRHAEGRIWSHIVGYGRMRLGILDFGFWILDPDKVCDKVSGKNGYPNRMLKVGYGRVWSDMVGHGPKAAGSFCRHSGRGRL